ncbi:MAG: hypothetical protein ACO3GP_09270 [Candidatus Limnocylindrus sp.]
MPLTITPQQKAAAGVLAGLRALAGTYQTTTRQLDSILSGILSLSDDDLAAMGNMIGEAEMTRLLDAHAFQVATVNALVTGTEAMQAGIEQRDPTPQRLASTATLVERLAEQRRVLTIKDGVFVVTTLPPEPEPEPLP